MVQQSSSWHQKRGTRQGGGGVRGGLCCVRAYVRVTRPAGTPRRGERREPKCSSEKRSPCSRLKLLTTHVSKLEMEISIYCDCWYSSLLAGWMLLFSSFRPNGEQACSSIKFPVNRKCCILHITLESPPSPFKKSNKSGRISNNELQFTRYLKSN